MLVSCGLSPTQVEQAQVRRIPSKRNLMLLADPGFWEVIKTPLQVISAGTLIAGVAWMVRWTWKLRGVVDDFILDQKEGRALVQKTLDGVEAAKKVAIDEVAAARQSGESKAAELKAGIDSLNINHLQHIQQDISEMNLKYDRLIGLNSKQLEVAQATQTSIAVLVALQQKEK